MCLLHLTRHHISSLLHQSYTRGHSNKSCPKKTAHIVSRYTSRGNHIVKMRETRRGPWIQQEDDLLLQLVRRQGAQNWVRISQEMRYRSPKQCRERYHQNLKSSLNHDPISPEEGILIERMVQEMGKRWAEIARRLGCRSDNAVKNWWNGSMNRRRRINLQRQVQTAPVPNGTYQDMPENLSFARPINSNNYSRPLSDIHVPPRHFNVRTPEPSPAVSDVSMSDSMGEAPSLMSDASSTFSTSPRMVHYHRGTPRHSPHRVQLSMPKQLELPPFHGSRAETRRGSLPILELGSRHFINDDQPSPTWSSSAIEGKTHLLPPLVSARPSSQHPHISPSTSHQQKHQFPVPQSQLPSIEMLARSRTSPQGSPLYQSHTLPTLDTNQPPTAPPSALPTPPSATEQRDWTSKPFGGSPRILAPLGPMTPERQQPTPPVAGAELQQQS